LKKEAKSGGGMSSRASGSSHMGAKTITFRPTKAVGKGQDAEADPEPDAPEDGGDDSDKPLRRDSEDRRPVRQLGLKKESSQKYWRGKLVKK
jgi:hypothetical protein